MFGENAIGNVTLGKVQTKSGGWRNSGTEGLPADRPVEYAGLSAAGKVQNSEKLGKG